MKRIFATDSFAFDASKRVKDSNGFLTVPGRICSAGNVQKYRKQELGLDGDGIVRMFRPIDEVHKAAQTFDGKPITLGHPREGFVTPDNWQGIARGIATDVAPNDGGLDAKLHIHDKKTIAAIDAGKATELSCGYTFTPDFTPGVSPNGEAYDGVMRQLMGNHVAIVDSARGGPSCRVADEQEQGEKKMAMRRLVFDKLPSLAPITIDVEDAVALQVESAVKAAMDHAGAMEIALDTALKEAAEQTEKLVAAHDKEIEELAASIPVLAAKMAKDRAGVEGAIAKFGLKLATDGKSAHQSRCEVIDAMTEKNSLAKNVVSAVLGATKVADASEADVCHAFDAMVAAVSAAKDAVKPPSAIGRALVGDAETETAPAPVGRAKMMQNSQSASQGAKQ